MLSSTFPWTIFQLDESRQIQSVESKTCTLSVSEANDLSCELAFPRREVGAVGNGDIGGGVSLPLTSSSSCRASSGANAARVAMFAAFPPLGIWRARDAAFSCTSGSATIDAPSRPFSEMSSSISSSVLGSSSSSGASSSDVEMISSSHSDPCPLVSSPVMESSVSSSPSDSYPRSDEVINVLAWMNGPVGDAGRCSRQSSAWGTDCSSDCGCVCVVVCSCGCICG
mmetsp:Transcript_13204/g.36469  ORF Transcript_13204/g.36469 Transcript_13204/m.36469 type:complete len:226 (+) Transcript_13204:386-1063(+)